MKMRTITGILDKHLALAWLDCIKALQKIASVVVKEESRIIRKLNLRLILYPLSVVGVGIITHC